jgi:hypothetical protein
MWNQDLYMGQVASNRSIAARKWICSTANILYEISVSYLLLCTLFGCSYQHGLSAVVQYFSLTTKQPQPAYKPQKQPAEQGDDY